MKPLQALHHWFSERLEATRLHLARPDALLQLALMGLLTGLAAGGIIVLFRFSVEHIEAWLLPGGTPDAFESLSLTDRLLFPLLGALALALMFRWFSKGFWVLGVARVLERMAYHQGRLTARGFWLQFFGVAIALVSGHSVGREGAHIFLGASAGSLLGQKLELPYNAVRTLVGCGTAAGIAASFNTPLAGVIFTLEVVMMDYQLASFIPIIIAAVSATVVSNAVLGDAAVFSVPVMKLGSLREIPLVVVLGLVAGAVAAGFIQSVQFIASRSRSWPVELQMTAAGASVALAGALLPEVMGIGYDTINATLLGGYAAGGLLLMALVKLLATSACSALNVPGGMIGPSFFIGATLGGGLGHLLAGWLPALGVQPGLYAMLGMGALMAGSLQAPLAALTALLELTDNPGIIMPGMLVVVTAGLTASELFGKKSLFITMLEAKGLNYAQSPVMAALRRIGVASVMERSFVQAPRNIEPEEARRLLDEKPRWVLVSEEREPTTLLAAVDLAAWLEENPDAAKPVDLLAIPARRLEARPVHLHDTLQEAREALERTHADALYVRRMTAPGFWRVYGVLTREQIESAYR